MTPHGALALNFSVVSKVCFLIRPFAPSTPNVTMPLVQILRSRAKFAVPLLRQSIRVNASAGPIRPRCFVTSLPRAQELEIDAPAETIVEETAVGQSSKDPILIEGPRLPPSTPQKPYVTGFVIRRVEASTGPGVTIQTAPKISVIRAHTSALEQGYSIVRISKFIEVLRDPTVTPLGAAIVRRISLGPENNLMSKTFLIHISDVVREREFMRMSTNSTQSPIMERLEITSIEDDRHRYIAENLRDVGYGSANCLDPKVHNLINRWKRAEFFTTRRLAENVEAIRKAPRGANVIYEWQTGKFLSIPPIEALEKAATEQRYLIHAIRRAAGIPDPGFISLILPWSSDLYSSIINQLKKSERQASAILKRPHGTPTATVIGESIRYELPVAEVLEKFSNIGDSILQMTKTLIDCCIAGEPDLHSIRLTNMRKSDKKVMKNLKSLRLDPTADEVVISTMNGNGPYRRSDGIRVVEDQIDRNIRILTFVLSEMGIPPKAEPSPRPRGVPRPLIRHYGASVNSRREFSTMTSRHRQPGRSKPPSRHLFPRVGLMKKPGFGQDWRRKAPEVLQQPPPRPAPGDSVRDMMVGKERERSKIMGGLAYSLLPGDRQEDSAGVQTVVENESFQDVGMWESDGEVGVLTDESGIEPLRKGDMCEIR